MECIAKKIELTLFKCHVCNMLHSAPQILPVGTCHLVDISVPSVFFFFSFFGGRFDVLGGVLRIFRASISEYFLWCFMSNCDKDGHLQVNWQSIIFPSL